MDMLMCMYFLGMYSCLVFLVVVNMDFDIFIIDEVLLVGDVKFCKKVLVCMFEFVYNVCIMLFVSYVFGIIKDMCDEVIWLYKGCFI